MQTFEYIYISNYLIYDTRQIIDESITLNVEPHQTKLVVFLNQLCCACKNSFENQKMFLCLGK